MSGLDPQREPVAYPVVWFETAYHLHRQEDGALAEAIYRAMDARLRGGRLNYVV